MWSFKVKAALRPIVRVTRVQKIMTQHGPTKLQITDSYTDSQQLKIDLRIN